MDIIGMAARRSTVLWDGDVAVLGGSLAGLTAAAAASAAGKRTCLLEPGPSLGIEVSRYWQGHLADGPVSSHVLDACERKHAATDGRFDMFTATLAFDRFLAEAGVHSLVRVLPMRTLSDHTGQLTGIEVVGKSGRQEVKAATVLDATEGRIFSRRAAGQSPLQVTSVHQRLYVCGVDADANPADAQLPADLKARGVSVTSRPAFWPRESILTVTLPTGEGVIDQTVRMDALDAAIRVFEVLRASLPSFAKATLVDAAPALEPHYAQGTNEADPPPGAGLSALPMDQTLARDLSRVQKWVEAALAAPKRPDRPAVVDTPPTDTLETSELVADTAQDLPETTLPEAVATLHEMRDVAVAGYGTGGAFAALCAAEERVTVTVLDPAPFPGGIGTIGRIHSYYHGIPAGRQKQIDEHTAGEAAALAEGVRGFHPTGKAHVLLQELRQPGVDIRSGHIVFGVVRQGTRVEGLVSANEDGYHVFPCKVAVDATGDGDVAAAAGAEFTLGRDGDGFPQPYSYTPSLVREGVLHHRNFDAGWVDPTDTMDFSRAHFEGRRVLWDHYAPTQQEHYCTLASVLGLREARFVTGQVRLTFEDFLNGRTYPDTVCRSSAHHDNHAMDYAEESEWSRRHVVMFGLWQYACAGDIPLQALLPRGLDGLLVACRALSVDHDLHQLVRMQRDLQQLGEVCGVAAALAARDPDRRPLQNVDALQAKLRERGILPATPPEPTLDVDPEEALRRLGTDDNGVAMWRLAGLPPDRQPDWSAFFDRETDPIRRFPAAVALALGQGPGELAIDTLEQAIREHWAEPALGIKSPPRYVVAALALAELRTPGATDALGELLGDEAMNAPTLLLVLRAIGATGDRRGIAFIHDFLDRTETETFQTTMWGCSPDTTKSFRFAVELLAVRALVALGCKDDVPRLNAYRVHPHLLIRKYARRILREAEA